MKALVTGGNGFVGSHVVAALREAGRAVRVLDRAPPVRAMDGVEQFTADLLTSDHLDKAFDGVDVMVHLASLMRGSFDEMMRVTVEGTRRLLDTMARTGCRRIVHTSSFSVYDWSRLGDEVSEDSPVLDESTAHRLGAYAASKTAQECLVRHMAREHGWGLTVLRPAVIWGRGVWGEFLVGKRIGPLQLVFAPSAMIRIVYVENAAQAFARAAERDGDEVIVNVIDDPQATTWRYADVICRRRGGIRVPAPYGVGMLKARTASLLTGGSTRLPYFLQPQLFEALHKPVRWSNRRLREALQWTPRYTFDQAVARATVDA